MFNVDVYDFLNHLTNAYPKTSYVRPVPQVIPPANLGKVCTKRRASNITQTDILISPTDMIRHLGQSDAFKGVFGLELCVVVSLTGGIYAFVQSMFMYARAYVRACVCARSLLALPTAGKPFVECQTSQRPPF